MHVFLRQAMIIMMAHDENAIRPKSLKTKVCLSEPNMLESFDISITFLNTY